MFYIVYGEFFTNHIFSFKNSISEEGTQEGFRQNVPIAVGIIREVLRKRCQRAYGFLTDCLGRIP